MVIRGDNTIQWGSNGVYTGYVVSARDQATGEMVEIPDNVGEPVALVIFNTKFECEIEVIVQTTTVRPNRGDLVTLFGRTNTIITETEKIWAQKDTQKLRIRATKFPNF